ncbi:hypothetical protein ACAG25_16660 [Mycobacterium sp. pV006]|uniref:hypothetical protein n=1 Tax=Mycobacterium sp. pV006 TaxID=3238983 RepID=UPI00351BDAB3
MGRTAAVIWHASFSLAAGVLYFFFVLPRTFELLGETSHTLGTVLRVVTAVLIGTAAVPVLLTLLRTRRPEFGTPQLALNLRTTSIALHVLAGVLILGVAISEIWLSVDSAGQWLFGIYGAAAAIALLGVLAFHLAFVAELPPPPPKPVKVKQRRSRGKTATEDTGTGEETETPEAAETSETAETDEASGTEADADESSENTGTGDADEAAEKAGETEPPADGKLQNQRPSGKTALLRRRRRTRGGVAVED